MLLLFVLVWVGLGALRIIVEQPTIAKSKTTTTTMMTTTTIAQQSATLIGAAKAEAQAKATQVQCPPMTQLQRRYETESGLDRMHK